MNPQIQGCMEKIREMDVPESKKIQLCSVLAGIENSNNEEAKLQSWYKFLNLFFNDQSIIEEIYKKMKTDGLCFLHEVGIYFDSYKDAKHLFFVLKHAGKLEQTVNKRWDAEIYYKTNIRDCKQELMAIPITLIGKYGPHSNMLIIRKQTKKNPIRNIFAYLNKTIIKKEKNETIWEIEHFEPHGKQKHEERDINKAIDDLVHDILNHDAEYNKDNIKITHPNQLCKLTGETNETLQDILRDTKYGGSCTMFSMWYSFNRILYPEKESAQIYEEMNHTLLSSKNPSETIENIILSFVSLINIDIDSFKIGNDRFLMTATQKIIENNLQQQNPTINGIKLESEMFEENETLKINTEIHFLKCILPSNCFNWVRNNATIEFIEIVDCFYEKKDNKIPFYYLFYFIHCPNLKHLKIVGSINFESVNFEVRDIGWILEHEDLESVNFGNNHIQLDVAKAILDIIKKNKKPKLKSFNILDDDNNENQELKQIQDEINKLLTPDTLGGGLQKTRKKKKGKNKKRSTKPKTKNNYKRNI